MSFASVEKPLSDVPVVVLDTETTGPYPGLGHRIVEIAAIRFDQWREVGRVNELIDPGRAMDPGASRVNGIYDEDLAGAPPFATVEPALTELLAGALVVAHNAPFDAGFLALEYSLLQYTGRANMDSVWQNPWLCTLQLARRHFYFGRNNLGHVARRLGVRTGRAHRALNDVFTTAEILKRMARELAQKQRMTTVADLLHAQGGAIRMPPPPTPSLPEPVREALRQQQQLRILYAGTGGQTDRVVDPLYPTEHKGTAYLIAFCHLRQAQRTFRLDRILHAERA